MAPARTHRRGAIERNAVWLGLLAFTVIAFLWFAKTWVDPLHRHAGVLGDPDSYIWALAWPPFAVAHGMNPFFSGYLLAPQGANLMWTIPPGFGLLLWPVTAIFGPVFSYNLLATLSLALSAWAAQLALRRFVPGELGPFVGALFYGFSPYMAAHSIAHAMLTVAILPPLLLLLLHETLVRQRWRPIVTGFAIGLLLVFQLSTFLEMLAGGAVAAGLVTLLLAIIYRRKIRERARYVAVVVGTGVVTVLILGGLQLWTLLFGDRNLVHVTDLLHPPNTAITDVLGFVVPSDLNAFAPEALQHISKHFSTAGAELNGFIGVPLLLICLTIAVKHWRSTTVRVTAIVTVVMALLSMGPRLQFNGHSTIPLPWALIARLPLMGNLLPVRLSVFTDLGIAMLIAYGIGHRVRPATPRRNTVRAVAIGAAVLTLLPSWYLLTSISAPVNVPDFFTSARVKTVPKGSIALVAPWSTDPSNVAPQVWQSFAHFRFKLPSGYAYVPLGGGAVSSGLLTDALEASMWRIGHGMPAPDLNKKGVRAELRRLIEEHGISTVIVGPMKHQATMLHFMTDVLGRSPEQSGGVYVWHGVGE